MRVDREAVGERRVLTLDGTATDVAIIKSVMYYPDDATFRSKYLNWHRLLEADRALNERVDMGPSVDQHHLAERTRRATTAGAILASYYLLNRLIDPPGPSAKPSLEMAMFVVEELAFQADTFGDGSRIAASTKTLKKCWKEYRSSAPLWAAMWLNEQDSPYAFMSPDSQFDDAVHVDLFIGVAKSMREFGTRTSSVQRRALLDDRATWDFPKQIVARPARTTAAGDDRLRSIMSKYKPRKTEYISRRPVK